MFKCKVVYGADVEPHASDSPIRIGDLRRNEDLKAVLGFTDNVNFMVNGVTMPDEAIVPNDATVVVEIAANKKARLELAIA
jgi:hypothetical protein